MDTGQISPLMPHGRPLSAEGQQRRADVVQQAQEDPRKSLKHHAVDAGVSSQTIGKDLAVSGS